ncbi:autophagy protein 7 [Thecamonas trahens ATCC 50062]|uniref:Autophagy protein 7 n=1 Tax=Thecamonas trahens ATCC 50062 TaxID=461836 RepID=A0A0L0DEV4_THETB|nr:autophagy protein 7 [Thecamonas trahens ATCC 50062]KNC50671.1 autophagy protein 7 [Thecamonas trahens ATCC 50062]|eukprot:XP_013762551.1 autophagy protein 7 [Thecamonas trahens ATCC 50062]
MQGVSAGLHSGAFYVSRSELLGWLNETLDLSYQKIEEVSNGAAFCQLCDMLFPGTVPMSKVNFSAKYEYDKLKNYKVLQSVFEKNNVPKVVDAHKLVKGKPMDNLEFFQWFKHFFDANYAANADEYKALARRKGQANAKARSSSRAPGASGSRSRSRPRPGQAPGSSARRSATRNENAPPPSTGAKGISAAAMKAKIDEVKAALEAKHAAEIEALKEQLRDIEILAEAHEDEDIPFLKQVQDLLYKSDDSDDEGADDVEDEAVEA